MQLHSFLVPVLVDVVVFVSGARVSGCGCTRLVPVPVAVVAPEGTPNVVISANGLAYSWIDDP
jgi:hypothetical protein